MEAWGGGIFYEAPLFSGSVTQAPVHRKGPPHVLLFAPILSSSFLRRGQLSGHLPLSHPQLSVQLTLSLTGQLSGHLPLSCPQLSVGLTLSLTASGCFLPSLATSSSVVLTHPLFLVSMLSLTKKLALGPLTNWSATVLRDHLEPLVVSLAGPCDLKCSELLSFAIEW